nr:MAG TPA: hypothetical protein [Caudoviricetes sp.]
MRVSSIRSTSHFLNNSHGFHKQTRPCSIKTGSLSSDR